MNERTSDAIERGITLLKCYFESDDHFISDIEMGACVISRMYKTDGELDTESELYKEFLSLFSKFVKAEVVAGNFSGLRNMLAPGMELFPDKKKYPLWWLPETMMTEKELKEWKKYLKKSGYKTI